MNGRRHSRAVFRFAALAVGTTALPLVSSAQSALGSRGPTPPTTLARRSTSWRPDRTEHWGRPRMQ